jgi:NADPH:quinone reductase-like Zn-dependent oxidoreductase
MPLPQQTALIQADRDTAAEHLPLIISSSVSVPRLLSKNHVLVRVLAVALNPTDHKMITHFPRPGDMVGCDFCGVVEKLSDSAASDASSPAGGLAIGTRVCGGVFPYARSEDGASGAFAEWVVADARLLLRVPGPWSDLQAAAVGSIGWGTVGLAISDPDALGLQGLPSLPSTKKEPVLVYGGATASGAMACQLLRL